MEAEEACDAWLGTGGDPGGRSSHPRSGITLGMGTTAGGIVGGLIGVSIGRQLLTVVSALSLLATALVLLTGLYAARRCPLTRRRIASSRLLLSFSAVILSLSSSSSSSIPSYPRD